MGIRHYQDLVCWQLASALKKEVYALTDRAGVKSDFKFCQQVRDSARSAPSNIAEGFARFRPADFARFLEIARASLAETHNHLLDARDLAYLSDEDHAALSLMADRASGATTRLLLYLRQRAKPHRA